MNNSRVTKKWNNNKKWATAFSLTLLSCATQSVGGFNSEPSRIPSAVSAVTNGSNAVDVNWKPSAALPAGYQLTWSDEFPGNTLDQTKWLVSTKIRDQAQQTASAITVNNGNLRITYYTVGSTNYTAFIKTQGKFETAYGFFEARMRFNDSPGTHSSFWLSSSSIGNPVGGPGLAGTEIDVVEHRATGSSGKKVSGGIESNLHWDGYAPGVEQSLSSGLINPPGLSPQNNFHVYGVLWTPQGYTFYYDGQVQWTETSAISNHPEFILLTGEVQNNSWAGAVPAGGYGIFTQSHTSMDVSWVRVWQSNSGNEK